MSNLVDWAEKELNRLVKDDDEMQKEINKDILEVVKVFSEQGHSGFSASYALNIIKRLLAREPITPLTGEDNEWVNVHDNTYQNKRCSAVFKEGKDNANAYYIDGKVFSDDGGKTWFTNKDSSVPVIFPYTVPEHSERVILK